MSFALQWVSCRQRVIGSHFPPICYSVSFGALSLLTFDVIIDSYVFIAILNLVLSLILCFFFVPFFFYFSFCGMMIFSHIMLMFFFFNLLYAFDLRLLCQICKPLSISTYLRLVVSIGSNTFWGKKNLHFPTVYPQISWFWCPLLHLFFFLAVHCGYHCYTFSFFQICVLTYFPVMIFPFLWIFTSFLENFQYCL